MNKKFNFTQHLREILKKPFSFKYYQHRPDYGFIITLGIIIFLGLLVLSSASSVLAFQKFNDSYRFLKHQIVNGFIPGLVLFYFASQFDYRNWKKYAFRLLLATVVLLILVFIPGVGVTLNNAKSWLRLGPIVFQPAEIVKFTFLVYLATWLEKKGQLALRNVQYGFLPFLFSLGTITTLILLQPDLGSLLIIFVLSIVVYFVAGASLKHLGIIIGLCLLIIFACVQLAPYRLDRITAFFNPDIDPQGTSYQVSQARLAIGSGGILGLGIGKSRQKFNYLPEVYGDSIFAIMAEELGLVFSFILLFLFLNFASRGFKIARKAPDEFGRLLTVGIVSWISFQAIVNIGAMVGILPLTGLPLPFISSGGSSMVVVMFACGVIVNISKQTK